MVKKTINNIYLIGLMGSGKTTIGKVLAKKTNRNFVDSDTEIVKRNGVDIQTIFDVEGESGFRKREQFIINELSQLHNQVIATGGGVILNLTNRMILSNTGVVIYLQSNIKTLYSRTKKDSKRPLLKTDNPKQKLATLYQERDYLYRSLANKVVHADNNQSVLSTTNQIINFLNDYENSNS